MNGEPRKITQAEVICGAASIDQYREQEGIPTPPVPYCTARPTPNPKLGAACGQCGHAALLHIGTDHCPVCEMADLNRRLAHIVRRELDAEYRRAAAARARYRRPDGTAYPAPR